MQTVRNTKPSTIPQASPFAIVVTVGHRWRLIRRQMLGAYETKLAVGCCYLATLATAALASVLLPKLDVAGSSPVARSLIFNNL